MNPNPNPNSNPNPNPNLNLNPILINPPPTNRRTHQIQQTLTSTFQRTLFTNLYPASTIALTIHILSDDGSLLAACLNAASLALVDAGVPTKGYVAACTVGVVGEPPAAAGGRGGGGGVGGGGGGGDPLLDLNGQEELDVPGLSVATVGGGSGLGLGLGLGGDAVKGKEEERKKVVVCNLETKVQVGFIEGMLAVGVDGCERVRGILNEVVREKGRRRMMMTMRKGE